MTACHAHKHGINCSDSETIPQVDYTNKVGQRGDRRQWYGFQHVNLIT